MHRSLQDRKRQSRRPDQGRHADRQRADRHASRHHDRQRSGARQRHRHLRQERPGRSGRRWPADTADGSHHRRRHGLISLPVSEGRAVAESAGMKSWAKNIFDVAVIVLVVVAAKTAIAEPYYVPSGSMEPTLQIGDELLATKYPYGYSSASLPPFITLPDTQRILAALPERGDIVVFRWPGDRSQIWVKRVVGLPGDRIGMH